MNNIEKLKVTAEGLKDILRTTIDTYYYMDENCPLETLYNHAFIISMSADKMASGELKGDVKKYMTKCKWIEKEYKQFLLSKVD